MTSLSLTHYMTIEFVVSPYFHKFSFVSVYKHFRAIIYYDIYTNNCILFIFYYNMPGGASYFYLYKNLQLLLDCIIL